VGRFGAETQVTRCWRILSTASQYVHLPYGGREVRKGDEPSQEISGGAGSVSLRRAPCRGPFVTLLAVAATAGWVKFRSDPCAGAWKTAAALSWPCPLKDVSDNFYGDMPPRVVSLDSIVHRLQKPAFRGRTVFLVDHNGRLVAHRTRKNFVPGGGRQQRFACCASEGAAAGSFAARKRFALPRRARNTRSR